MLEPAENLVAAVDMGPRGRHLSIGSRLVGDCLQWYDGRELHLARGAPVAGRSRRRSFEFRRVSDGQVITLTRLVPAGFEKHFRERFPDAPRDAGAAELNGWLLAHHGLWPLD